MCVLQSIYVCIHVHVLWCAVASITYHSTDIVMPPIVRKRGCPEGHEVTVIGLPAKKQKKSTTQTCKPKLQPFIKLHTSLKEKGKLICVYVHTCMYSGE